MSAISDQRSVTQPDRGADVDAFYAFEQGPCLGRIEHPAFRLRCYQTPNPQPGCLSGSQRCIQEITFEWRHAADDPQT